MRNLIITISVMVLCNSCFVHSGRIINGQCRPKNPNFKLIATPFEETNKIIFNKVYTKDGQNKLGLGFYDEGRIIIISNYNYQIQNYDLITNSFIKSKNWNNPENIGYWRIEGNKIKTEYFSCSNSGDYIREQGEIKGDTIIFERDCGTSNPFKTIKCPEKYILSDMSFE
jgi:hypothetical protein